MATETTTKPSKVQTAEEAFLAFKLTLLDCLSDEDICKALRAAIMPTIGQTTTSDADHAANMVDLINRLVRPEALRRVPEQYHARG